MASNKFFTNTYITGTGRQNYLRVDYLEDPLFTSFTFDIDFISSPLFYTINNYTYPHPDNIGISEQIQNALGEMRKKMLPDQGYDILPLYSAEFFKGDKLGFGLQQNVYMDLPLYGATEYIYMVDKRNGDRSQNDVRYDNSGSADFANNGGFKSYKLGDSVREAVSQSDYEWANRKNEEAYAQIAECDKILTPENKQKHDAEGDKVQDLLKSCEEYKILVNGVEIKDENGEIIKNPMMTEEEILAKVNEYKQKENGFEQLKKDIANRVNDEISSFQNKASSIFNRNSCVKEVMSFDDSTKRENVAKLEKTYNTVYWRQKYMWDENGNENDGTYVRESLKLYNNFETYDPLPGAYNKSLKKDDGKSLLLKDKLRGTSIVRPSIIEKEYKDKLLWLGLMEEGKSFNLKVEVLPLKDMPEWAYNIAHRVDYWTEHKVNEEFTNAIIVDPLCYKCDADTCFDSFDSQAYNDNYEMLGRYEYALDQIRSQLYGTSGTDICDMNNPSPDSMYGQYLEAKNKHENDEYAQAEKTKAIAQSGIIDTNSAISNDGQSTTEETSNGVSTNIQQTEKEQEHNIITPQTVLDMLGFISGMRRMTTEYPYIIQSITGLDKAYETHYGVKDPYLGSGDNKIVLTCWESLDLRVTTMFNRYFNAVYDRQYRRERVPVNLRRFNCSVYVHDVRNFVTNNSKGQYENRMLELTDMYYSAIEFKFYDCEIVPEETGNIFNDISNEAPTEMKKTNFTFTYGNCVVNFVPQSEVAKYR